jgi:hypothetical protein
MMSRRSQRSEAIARSGPNGTVGVGRTASGFRRIRLLTAIAFAFAAVSASTGLAHAETLSAERIREAARVEISKSRYQRDLPIPPNAEASEPAPGSRDRPNPGSDRSTDLPRMPLSESVAAAARAVLWVLLGIVVVLLVVYVSNEIPRFLGRRSRSSDPAANGTVPVQAAQRSEAPEWIDEADRLASGGTFGPAIHSLLLALVAALYGRLGRRLSPSLTGREIVDAAGLPAESGAALSRIVAAAERGHFGGYSLGRAEYETCREDYDTVSASIGAGA